MRYLFLLLSFVAHAQLTSVNQQSLPFYSIVKNSGFENGKANWTATAGSFTVSSNNPISGKYRGEIDFSASSQYLRSELVDIPKGLWGKNCLARFKYGGGGTADIYYRVTDGTNTLAGYTATSTSFKITTAPSVTSDSLDMAFPCPATGAQLRIEFEAAGNAAQLLIDDVYIGENFRVGTVAQAELVGTIKIDGCSSFWSTTSGSYGDFSVNTGCSYTTTGKISNPSTMLPGFNLSGAPGNYMIVATGLPAYLSTAASTCGYRMTDGTDTSIEENVGTLINSGQSNLSFSILKSTTFSTQFRIQAKRINGTGNCETYGLGTNSYPLTFKVYRFPLAADTVVSAGVPYQGGSLIYPGTTNCNWESTSGTWANFAADTDCPTPTVTGNVQAPGTKIPGMTVASLEAGEYMVVLNAHKYIDGASSCSWRISDGTNTSATLIGYAINTATTPSTFVGRFSYSSKQSNLTFQVQTIRTSGANTCSVNNATASVNAFEMFLIPLSPSITMPNLVGSVTSNTSGSERIERATITYSAGTPTIVRQSGSWIDSLDDVGTGQVNFNIKTGMFSAAPTCTCSTEQGLCQLYDADPSVSDVQFWVTNPGGTAQDYPFNVICVGPR